MNVAAAGSGILRLARVAAEAAAKPDLQAIIYAKIGQLLAPFFRLIGGSRKIWPPSREAA
eukprot:SAG31_NODE_16753_length_697_cov_1.458194_1_plen_59_part_10